MEAHSLASLNRLAANPPAYPTNPSEVLQEPLTLYISRVPGTRDVILSPFKPQLKNVTGEDVANCLYYVHLDMPTRDDGVGILPRTSCDETSSTRTIQRKPVPGPATPILSEGPAPSTPPLLQRRPVALSSDGDQSSYLGRQRGASLGSMDSYRLNVAMRDPNDPGLGLTPPTSISARKPLGPRAFVATLFDSEVPSPPTLRDLQRGSAPASPVYETIRARESARNQDSQAMHRHSRSLSPTKQETTSAPFTLNLIRRDPGTSSQWNVGRISSYQLHTHADNTLLGTDHSVPIYPLPPPEPATQHPPINIQIETSGYAKFRNSPITCRESLDINAATAAQLRASLDSGALCRTEGGLYFSRQVTMAYSKSWTSNLSNLKEKIHNASSRRREHGRSESAAFIGTADWTVRSPEPPPSQHVDKMKARGYTFQSPWDKRCEFRTGNGGRSVLCRHVLNDSSTVAYNPLVADAPKPSSVLVSDLRFNLPGADLFPPADGQKDAKENKLGHFGKLLKSAIDRNGEEADMFVSPFDLNIGGERAGGGSHGTRAKLGKLIIYHDGLKMLDLLVAANIGLWWGAWEKSF